MASSKNAGPGNNGLFRVRLSNIQEAPRLSQAEQKIRIDALQSLDLPKASEERPKGNETIQANYFSVRPVRELIDKKIKIRKYKIAFDKLQSPLRNREDIRDLIEEIFKQHKPQSTSWTTDYCSSIVSTDPLYRECSDEAGSAISIGHEQTIQLNDRKQTIKTTSTLYFEGFFDMDSLGNYLRARRTSTQQLTGMSLSGQNRTYVPLEDFRILNLISWETIISSSFKGGRVENKFYPYCNPRRIVNQSNARFMLPQHYVYDVHMGFFTSMRPGHGSILLNVSTTTTAFFPSKMKLQTWLDARWGHSSSYTGVAPRTEKNEIKGVQVTFDLDQVPRRYVISDVHDFCVEKAKSGVLSQDGSSKSVWEDMQSCYPGSTHTFNKTASCVNVGNSSRLQANNEESISDLVGMVKERLQLYQDKNEGNLPLNILYYRDGVSESQFGMVLTQELPQIVKACKEFTEKQGKPNIRITLLVVTKRHHTRFFPLKLDSSTKNIDGGLVVDKHITNPNQMSFFLQSHDSSLGTARPTLYTVINNQSNLTLDQLQQATHKLSFVGSRATKGLSVCVPARYADILCDRLRCYMKPVLDGGFRRTQAQIQSSKSPLAHYHWAQQAWIRPGSNRTNPWHPNLDNIMFYL